MHLTQLLHHALQREPGRIATICGDRTRTVAESFDRIARFAGALRSLGIAPGDRVGIIAVNSDRYHEYLCATAWIGAVVNPVNIRWSPAEIAYSLHDSDTRILLVDDVFAEIVPALHDQFRYLETVIFVAEGDPPAGMLAYEALIEENLPVEDTCTGGDALLGIFYTGGTTGRPKGVMLSHDNLLTAALGVLSTGHVISHGGRMLHAAPMFHLADIALWTMGSVVGSTHVFIPTFTTAGVVNAVAAHAVTDLLLVPTMIQMLADDPALGDPDLTSVRNLVYGAAPMPVAVLEQARKLFPSASFTQAYGMTELSPIATVLSPADHDEPALLRAAGRPAPHCEVRVVDTNDHEAPRGTVGEIVVRGDNVMLGYWNRPDETAAALRGGWMHTGDGGYMNDQGYLFVVDRIKDMIVTGGENVYSAEVENALALHPSVAACAVIGAPDQQWGERVHAFVVLKPGEQVSVDNLREHCRTLIANYKVPRSADFVDTLPMSAAGKVLKRELRRLYWDDATNDVP